MSEPEKDDVEAAEAVESEESDSGKQGEAETQETKETPKEEAGEERRRTYRLNKVLGATLTSNEGSSKATRLFVIDISSTGFRATDHVAPSEEEYEISIVLSKGEEPFQSKMKVVWVKELTVSGMFQMGCEFVDTDPEQEQKLVSFIEAERGKVVTTSTVNIGRPWTMIG